MLLHCCFAFVLPIIEYCSPVWRSASECHFLLLERQVIRWPGFVPIRVSCCCVIDVVWLGLVSCAKLIRTLIAVCSASFHLLLLEIDIPELWAQLIHWSLKYQGVERLSFLGLSCRPRLECGMAFNTLRLTPERWMGSWVQLTVGRFFPELCFLQFFVAHELLGLRKQFISNFVSPTWACAAGFNNNNPVNNNQYTRSTTNLPPLHPR